MTITVTDPNRSGETTSLHSALARVAAHRAPSGPESGSPYSSVRVRMTISDGRVTDVVAV